MEVKEIKNKEIWEGFLAKCSEKTFLNAWNWGAFQETMGSRIWRLGFFENSELVSVALVVKNQAKRGSFLLVPHGPNIITKDLVTKYRIAEALLKELKSIGAEEGVDFLRLGCIWENNPENASVFEKLGFRLAPIHAHPEASWKLDISLSEEKILSEMRKTTRYLIRQAEKNSDIEVVQSRRVENLNVFDVMQQELVKHQHFIPFSLEYMKNEFYSFDSDEQVALFFGKYKGEVVAGSFVLFWSGIGFYHHAVLSPQHHDLPISYLMQWQAIKEAKKRGCVLYDFWGFVDPQKNPKHPWAGPTLFKMGFGGRAYHYLKTYDFPLSFKYYLTFLFEKLRKAKRGL
jgi:lipid II:glycine glycyltransferase (peptidoglycan interpeptide bridge formation enzyme)